MDKMLKSERRKFLMGAGLLAGALTTGRVLAAAKQPLRIGLTPAFLHDRHGVLLEWKNYLEKHLRQPVSFVLRDSYADTMNLIKQRQLDAAWLCDYPYVLMKPQVHLLVTPLNQGRPYYRSLLIVPAGQKEVRSISDLEGKVFAYADPYSNTGYLAPRHEIRKLKREPDSFFRKTFFTWSHRKAIEAVAYHLADGAAVDSYVWESLEKVEPGLTWRTRVVSRSEEYGFPPVVVQHDLPREKTQALRRVLLNMSRDHEGQAILAKLHLSGFAHAEPELYGSVEEMVRQADNHHNGAF
jgi:phosphonate transport system substrate-binding protein